MVMGLIFLLYADMFALKMNLSPDQSIRLYCILVCTHGIQKQFLAVILQPVALALRKVLRKDTLRKLKVKLCETQKLQTIN